MEIMDGPDHAELLAGDKSGITGTVSQHPRHNWWLEFLKAQFWRIQ